MPAATSLEDIYRADVVSGSLSSSYSPSSSSYHHFPDYYLRPQLTIAAEKRNYHNHRQQKANNGSTIHKHPLNLSATAASLAASKAVAISQTRQQTTHIRKPQQAITTTATYQQQQQQQQQQRFRQADMPTRGERAPLSEPIIFLYNDDDLSSSSAPDSFSSMSQAPAGASSTPAPLSGHHHHLTIEELRLALNSCWLCGCNWQQDHVSLDCQECGGYALTRPCPTCDGQCEQVWRRNINGSHDYHKALWLGECQLECQQADCCSSNSASRLAKEACKIRTLELRSDDDDDEDELDDSDEDCDDDCGIQVAIGEPAASGSLAQTPNVCDDNN